MDDNHRLALTKGNAGDLMPTSLATKNRFLSLPCLQGYADQARSDIVGKPWMIPPGLNIGATMVQYLVMTHYTTIVETYLFSYQWWNASNQVQSPIFIKKYSP
jgi:hypothetical protein